MIHSTHPSLAPESDGSGPLVLMYHRVGHPSNRSKTAGQFVRPKAFTRQMTALARLRLEVIPLEEVARHTRKEARYSARQLAITFDDGFSNLYENAFPVLRHHSYPATIFLISRYTGQINTYHPPEGEIYERLLSADEILEMRSTGISFGSHSQHHARLTECSSESLIDEVAGSRQDLQQLLNEEIPSFCYPYGAFDNTVREAVVNAGYTLACSTMKGQNHAGDDPYLLRRINIRADTWFPVFLYKLARARWADR